jgi:hypothetical protein
MIPAQEQQSGVPLGAVFGSLPSSLFLETGQY